MRTIFVLMALFIIICSDSCLAQKRSLDYGTGDLWPIIRNTSISDDGKFVTYKITSPNGEYDLIVQAVDGSWKSVIPRAFEGTFSPDCKWMTFALRGDTVGILDLLSQKSRYLTGVFRFNLKGDISETILAYQKQDSVKTLIVSNLTNGREQQFPRVTDFQFNQSGSVLLMKHVVKSQGSSSEELRLLNVNSGEFKTICTRCEARQIHLDRMGYRLVFLTEKSIEGRANLAINYYHEGMDSAEIIADRSTHGMRGLVISDESIFFTRAGDRIFFRLEKQQDTDKMTNSLKIDAYVSIKGTNDLKLEAYIYRKYSAMMDLNAIERGVVRLQQDTDENFLIETSGSGECGGVACGDITDDPLDSKWDPHARPDIFLVSGKDGGRTLLARRSLNSNLDFSPTGRYLVWFDQRQRQWYSHDTQLDKTRNITSGGG